MTKADRLGYSLEEARDDAKNGTVKVFIAPQDLKRCQEAGEFGPLFRLIVSEVTDTNAWPTLFWPFQAVLQVTESQARCAQIAAGNLHRDVQRVEQATTFLDQTVRMSCDPRGQVCVVCAV